METDLSFVIPVLNEENTITELVVQIRASVPPEKSLEIILIDDGSTGSSPVIMDRLAQHHPGIKVIHFDRNYGKTAALACGFGEVIGRYIFTVDVDLQDHPAEVPAFLRRMEQGNLDVLCAWRKERRDSVFKRVASLVFNLLIRLTTGVALHDINCGYKCCTRKVAESLQLYSDMHRFVPLLARRSGFGRIAEIAVRHNARRTGQSKYGAGHYARGLSDLLCLALVATALRRLRIAALTGGGISLMGATWWMVTAEGGVLAELLEVFSFGGLAPSQGRG